jgi:hypothetical protein
MRHKESQRSASRRTGSLTQELHEQVVQRMLALKQKCLNRQGKPYIKTLIGGTNNNPDKRNVSLSTSLSYRRHLDPRNPRMEAYIKLQEAITHAFISEFASIEERNYYLHEDKVHLAFEASLPGTISRAFAIDFTPAVFATLAELKKNA